MRQYGINNQQTQNVNTFHYEKAIEGRLIVDVGFVTDTTIPGNNKRISTSSQLIYAVTTEARKKR